jgi:hypothetical protein
MLRHGDGVADRFPVRAIDKRGRLIEDGKAQQERLLSDRMKPGR